MSDQERMAVALRKVMDITGKISGLLYDEPPDRQKISVLADEAFMVAAAALGEGPLPEKRETPDAP